MTTNKSLVEYYQEHITKQAQQKFIDAVQQSDAYRAELTAYQDLHADETIPDDESIAMIESMNSVVSAVSSLYSSLISFGAAPTLIEPCVQIPVVATQQKSAPTQEELIRLYRARDAAFFEYMHSLNLDEKRDVPDAFERDETRVLAADDITRPYRNAQRTLLREMVEVSKNIDTALAAQRTWLDFMIENALPSFVLKAMNYMNFQALTQEKIKILSERFSVINESLTTMKTIFHKTWDTKYPGIPRPHDLDAANSITVAKIVNNIALTGLSDVYHRYATHKTVSNLLDFYRLAHQLRLQAIQRDDKEIISGQLTAISEQLERLHPDMMDNFAKEQACVTRELALFEQYPALPSVDQLSEETDPFTKFMAHIEEKYTTFLKDRTLSHFSELYQHIHSHPQFRHKKMVKDTRALLKSLYPQAYEAVRQHQITHMDEQACDEFLRKYESLKLDHPIYVKLMAFMRDPTHGNLSALQQEMVTINDDAHYLDHRVNAAMAEFMQICSTISIEDYNSDAYSEDSDEQSDAAEIRPSMDSFDTSVPMDDVETQTLSVQNLRAQNEQFATQAHLATSQHSLFAVTLNSAVHAESKQMLKEYLAYRAHVQTKLDVTLKNLAALSSTQSNGIVASLQLMASYLFHPVITLACLFMPDYQENTSIKSLSTKRNKLRDELFTMQAAFRQTWQEKFGTPAPMQARAMKDYMRDTDQENQDNETSPLLDATMEMSA